MPIQLTMTKGLNLIFCLILLFGKCIAQFPINLGNLPPGVEVTIKFNAKINPNTPTSTTHVDVQGELLTNNLSPVLTDDPNEPASKVDPTITPLNDCFFKPETLHPQNCNSCSQIRIFYCQGDPTPASPNDFIQGPISINPAYQSTFDGSSAPFILNWYDGNGTLLNGPPIVNTSSPNTNLYWVTQTNPVTLCESDPTRVRIRIRKSPEANWSNIPDVCFSGQVDLAVFASDTKGAGKEFAFFDANPAIGTSPFTTLSATNGGINPGQYAIPSLNPGSQNTFWLVVLNSHNFSPGCGDTSAVSFVVNNPPVIQPFPDLEFCPGETVNPPVFQADSSDVSFFWLNSNTATGLGMGNLGSLPPFVGGPNSIGSQITANVAARAIKNGCLSPIINFGLNLNPVPVMTSANTSLCSRDSVGFSFSLASGSIAADSFKIIDIRPDNGLSFTHIPQTNQYFQGDSLPPFQPINLSGIPLQVVFDVVLKSEDGCEGGHFTTSFTINPEPILLPQSQTLCAGQGASITLADANGMQGVAYAWPPPALSPQIVGIGGAPSAGPGTSITDTFITNSPQSTPIVYDITPQSSLQCLGQSSTVTLNMLPIPPSQQYELKTCETFLGSGQGVFDLTPYNDSLGGGYTVTWFDSDGQEILNSGAYQTGNKTVYASSQNPCQAILSLELGVNDLPPAPIVSALTACEGEPTLVIPTGPVGADFQFYDSDPLSGGNLLASGGSYDPQTVLTNSPQQIWVSTINPQTGCESNAIPVTITIMPVPAVQASANLMSGGICEGENLLLSSNLMNGLNWTGPGAFASNLQNPIVAQVEQTDEGWYYLTATNAQGCYASDSIFVMVDVPPEAGLSSSISLSQGATAIALFQFLGGTPEGGGIWAGPSPLVGGDQGTFFPAYSLPGIYTYAVTGSGGCLNQNDSSTVTVNIIPVPALQVATKVLLEGPFDSANGLMWDTLYQRKSIPVIQPYSQLGYTFVGEGGGESFRYRSFSPSGLDVMVDWVYVELRDSNNPATILASRAAMLLRDGRVVDVDGSSPVRFFSLNSGSYYVAIGHRNHPLIMSATPVALDTTSGSLIDFSNQNTPLYGISPVKQVFGVNLLYAGEASFNKQIQNSDDVDFWQKQVGSSGYWAGDYDLNGEVQNSDRNGYWFINVGQGSQVP